MVHGGPKNLNCQAQSENIAEDGGHGDVLNNVVDESNTGIVEVCNAILVNHSFCCT